MTKPMRHFIVIASSLLATACTVGSPIDVDDPGSTTDPTGDGDGDGDGNGDGDGDGDSDDGFMLPVMDVEPIPSCDHWLQDCP